jgi:hypothetical protein
MKSLKQLAVVATFAALAFTHLNAQSADLRANIPFDFHAGRTLMPAGEYEIQGHGPFVVFRSKDRSRAIQLLTHAAVSSDSSRDGRLVFKRYGNSYFLSKIWESFSSNGREVPTVREKELAKQGDVPVQAVVALASIH